MSQITRHGIGVIPPGVLVETLTGNSGGAVGPNGANNINVVGDGVTVNVVGNPGTNTLTISASGAVSDSYVTNSGTATPVLGVLNILGGSSISTSGSGNTVTINASAFPWVEVVGTSQGMVTNTGYIANNAGLVTLTLPAVASRGDIVRVAGKGAGGWLVAQNAGQSIILGSDTTTVGVTGSLASTNYADGVSILCITANTLWEVLGGIGTITVT